jgi:hypothetical protein
MVRPDGIPEYHGHKTMIDGTHVPLTEAEAKALWDGAMAAKAARGENMPTSRDALSVMIEAEQRMHELGWWLGGGLRVRKGDECAVSQTGSTGMWRGRVDDEGKYVHFGDSVSAPNKCWLKPLADLTEQEREWMAECDKREAEAFDADIKRYAAMSDIETNP